MDNLERINNMESILDEAGEALRELEAALDRMEGVADRMGELFEYYGSAEWYEDRELELPPDTRAGVLSEDLVYDAITDTREASFRMLELATDLLKK